MAAAMSASSIAPGDPATSGGSDAGMTDVVNNDAFWFEQRSEAGANDAGGGRNGAEPKREHGIKRGRAPIRERDVITDPAKITAARATTNPAKITAARPTLAPEQLGAPDLDLRAHPRPLRSPDTRDRDRSRRELTRTIVPVIEVPDPPEFSV
ncbi:MAG: hypothetical protein QOJ25_1301, partial [Solirubrobacteraceae bacterium]|nr:hypothetical protein [Solirubrobacteraceae bacterium]